MMTNEELIERLLTLDANIPVLVVSPEQDVAEVDGIEFNDDDPSMGPCIIITVGDWS